MCESLACGARYFCNSIFVEIGFYLARTYLSGNFIRVNQSMFSGASNVDSFASGKEVVSVKLPSVSSTNGSQAEDSDKPPIMSHPQPKDVPGFTIHNQQIPDLVTLSLLPKSQWQSLINLDMIKVAFQPQVIHFNSYNSF